MLADDQIAVSSLLKLRSIIALRRRRRRRQRCCSCDGPSSLSKVLLPLLLQNSDFLRQYYLFCQAHAFSLGSKHVARGTDRDLCRSFMCGDFLFSSASLIAQRLVCEKRKCDVQCNGNAASVGMARTKKLKWEHLRVYYW